MGRLERNRRENLYLQAQSGSKSAKDTIFELSYDIIKKKAIKTYELITNKIRFHYNFNLKYQIPNSIIGIDDIIDDLSVKTIYYLENYLENDTKTYFSNT